MNHSGFESMGTLGQRSWKWLRVARLFGAEWIRGMISRRSKTDLYNILPDVAQLKQRQDFSQGSCEGSGALAGLRRSESEPRSGRSEC